LESGRFLGQSAVRTRLGGKGPVAIDPLLTSFRLNNSLGQTRFAQRVIEVFVVFSVLERGERSRRP
jgi:hypothetical protein